MPRDGIVFENEAGAFQRRADLGDLKKGNITYANAPPGAQLLLQGRPQVQLDSFDEVNHTVVCI